MTGLPNISPPSRVIENNPLNIVGCILIKMGLLKYIEKIVNVTATINENMEKKEILFS